MFLSKIYLLLIYLLFLICCRGSLNCGLVYLIENLVILLSSTLDEGLLCQLFSSLSNAKCYKRYFLTSNFKKSHYIKGARYY